MDRIRSCLARVPSQWKTPRVLKLFYALELPPEIAALALFGIAQPDTYRTLFWQEGFNNGWNSSPEELIYAIANYRPMNTPLPWSQFTTNFNVVIAVLSVFLLLVKAIMTICDVFPPLLSAVLHAALTAIWAVSIHNQAGPDTTDPSHPQPGAPWYITKPCTAVRPGLQGYCRQAKGAFAATCILTALFFIDFLLSLYSLYPSKEFRGSRRSSRLSEDDGAQAPWELEAQKTPGTTGGVKSPTTPRTRAFNTLTEKKREKEVAKAPISARQGNIGLPLRHHIAMGEDRFKGVNAG